MRQAVVERFEKTHVNPTPGRTLIVGSYVVDGKPDRRKLYPDAVGIDMREGPGVDRAIDLEEPLPRDLGRFAHIDCISVLEHSRRPWLMSQNIERLLEPGGSLYITAPFVWKIHAYPDDYFRYTVNGVKALFSEIKWQSSALASNKLANGTKIDSTQVAGHPYMARTEACLFGHRT